MHLHSTYSDGEFTLAELRDVFLAQGCRFACMTDHAEYFDPKSIREYVSECESLSDDRLRLVAGLEYRCDRDMHILGYGATKLTQTTDPQEIIRHIDSQGALSVIAHPKNDFFAWIEGFARLPLGIEVWNTKYDGRYAPRPETFALLQRLQTRQPAMLAFFGQDLHWKKQFRGLYVEANCAQAESNAIFRALARGDFCGQKDPYSLSSCGVVAEDLLRQFGQDHERSRRMWRFLKGGKKALDRIGIKVPDSLKARLRKIF
jgi:hypothetical protein